MAPESTKILTLGNMTQLKPFLKSAVHHSPLGERASKEGDLVLCPGVPAYLRLFRKSPFASRIPYKFFFSSQPPGLQTCGSSVGDISTLTDVEPQAMTSHQELKTPPTELKVFIC